MIALTMPMTEAEAKAVIAKLTELRDWQKQKEAEQ